MCSQLTRNSSLLLVCIDRFQTPVNNTAVDKSTVVDLQTLMIVQKVQITTVTLTQFAPTWPDLTLVSACLVTLVQVIGAKVSLHRVVLWFERGIVLLNRSSIEHF